MNTALAAAFKYLPKVVEYAKADLGKRYSLLEDWEIRLKEAVPAPYVDEQVDIRDKRLVIKHYVSTNEDRICDGNTLVPEEVMGIPTVVGSLAHDPLYDKDRMKKIAKAWGWSVRRVRKWVDTIYGNILLQLARREQSRKARVLGTAWAHVSYAGVRMFGGFTRWAYRVFGVAVLAVLLGGGCSGCMSEIVDGFDDPVYEQTEGGAND